MVVLRDEANNAIMMDGFDGVRLFPSNNGSIISLVVIYKSHSIRIEKRGKTDEEVNELINNRFILMNHLYSILTVATFPKYAESVVNIKIDNEFHIHGTVKSVANMNLEHAFEMEV